MIEALDCLREINIVSVFLRLTLSMLCGGMIGLERGYKRRPAGFRTYMLVCLGATMAMLLGQYVQHILGNNLWSISTDIAARMDVTRFGAQVINGIGFLGTGTIVVSNRQEVKGLTTAAALWTSACMGLAIGAGFYECVLFCFGIIVLSIRVLPRIDALVAENAKSVNIYVEFQTLDNVDMIIKCIKSQDAQIFEVDIDREKTGALRYPTAVFNLRLNQRKSHVKLIAAISDVVGVIAVKEI